VATKAEVERAIRTMMKNLAGADVEPGAIPDRTIICMLTDLNIAYWVELKDGKMKGLRAAEPTERSDARITAKSDDLVGLIEGRISVASAFLMGKVRIDAPAADLLRMRRLF
jgi:predicted lipid carrier protein YhbT